MRALCSIALFSLLIVPGCSQSQYVIVEPNEFARTVDLHHTFIAQPPIDYQLFVENGRLRMRAVNNTDVSVKMIGGESYLVDPTGESHALRNQTIPAGSFIAFTMPPRRPRTSVGFGFGVGGGSDHTFGGVGVGTGWDGDGYYGGDEPPYYDWNDGDLRIHLALEHGADRHEHEFLFRREKK